MARNITVTFADGTSHVYQNAPDDVTPAAVESRASKEFGKPVKSLDGGRAPVTVELAKSAAPTDRQELLSSTPMRIAKGMKDPIDGSAQLLQRILPDKLVRGINKAADFVGGEGTFAGDVLGIKGMTKDQLRTDVANSEQEYTDARQATTPNTLNSLITGKKDVGIDLARGVGNVLSPVNMALGKVMPGGGSTTLAVAGKGATAGAVGAATQPVTSEDYWKTKVVQTIGGATVGAVLAPVANKIATSLARYVQTKMGGNGIKTPEGVEQEIRASFARDDIDVGQIPKNVMAKLTEEVKQSMASGKTVDAASTLRKMDFERAGIAPTTGQITRNPGQYSRELNLKGVQGVGEPLADRFAQQQAQISARLRSGTAGPDEYGAGQKLVELAKGKGAAMDTDIRASYKAFRDSTGKDLEVPLGGLAADYAKTLRNYGNEIPGAVRSQFEELGLLTGKQTKLLTIEDAENLIRVINNHYNPLDKTRARALDELRNGLQNAVIGTTENGLGMEAATLGKMARGTFADKAKLLETVPAFKAALDGAEPDDFVRKFVLNGKVRELNEFSKIVGPDGQKTMEQQMLTYLQKKAFGVNAAGDGAGSQARFNSELDKIGKNKLVALLGESKTDELYNLGRVMAYIQQRPAGSSVNESQTGAAVANLFNKIGGTVKGAPYINDFVIKPIGAFKDRAEVANALRAQLAENPAQLDPKTVNALARLMGASAVGAGASLGFAAR